MSDTNSKKRKLTKLPHNATKVLKVSIEDGQESQRPVGRLHKIRQVIPSGMTLSRKELRKELRHMKKARRNAYNRREAIPTLAEKLSAKHSQFLAKQELARQEEEKKEKKREKNAAKRQARIERKKAYEKQEKLRLQKEEHERLTAEADDREIKHLEKLLHLNKRKSKTLPKKFVEEGLDYILDCIDPNKVKNLEDEGADVWIKSGSESGSDSEERTDKNKSKKAKTLENDSEEETPDDFSGDEMGQSKSETAESSGNDESDNEDSGDDLSSDPNSEDSETHIFEDEEDNEQNEDEGDPEESDDMPDEPEEEIKEDIYGRLRDSQGNVITAKAYVPPALRKQLVEGSEARQQRLLRIKKQIKGQLNRLSESNMISVSHHIESMYQKDSRADINDCLKDLVQESALSDIITPERLSMELAMLVAYLHNNIGTEVGAGFLELLADSFNSLHSSPDSDLDESKKLDNVTAFLCHLYSFQVTHSVLITDIINILIQSFKDKDIELILLMLKNIGFILRKDDPITLRDIILKAQQKASSVDIETFKDKSRVKFMLDILLAIKNNNVRKIPNYDTSHADQLRKLLKANTKGNRLAVGQLRISYNDLLEAKDKGKWWVVGSAWQGVGPVPTSSDHSTEEPQSKSVTKYSSKLLDLARQQRMNTETRRNVFCAIMSAEDYVDGFEKLLKLDLNPEQEKDIVIVILECCCNEKQYNAFYTHLLNRFVVYHRRFLFNYQTTMWDKFKVMSSLNDGALDNLATLTAYLITEQSVPLSFLKNFDFAGMNKQSLKFLKTLLHSVFKSGEKLVAEIFYKVGTKPALKHLKEGLELFMHHFLLLKYKGDDKQKLERYVLVAENALNLNKEVSVL